MEKPDESIDRGNHFDDDQTYNNSLVFGNNGQPENTQVDNSHVLQDVSDKADESLIINTQPIDYLPKEKVEDTKIIHTKKVENDTQRIDDIQNVETQKMDDIQNDTQKINNTQKINDTQTINDTQKIHNTQTINNTQKINNTQTINDTQKINDTQTINIQKSLHTPHNTKVPKPNESLSHDTQIINTTPTFDKISNDYTPGILKPDSSDPIDISSGSPHKNDFTKSTVQIPGTVEKERMPKTQVFNTQEELIDTTFQVDSNKAVVSSSPQKVIEAEESIETDDEKDTQPETHSSTAVPSVPGPYEDSIVTHRLRNGDLNDQNGDLQYQNGDLQYQNGDLNTQNNLPRTPSPSPSYDHLEDDISIVPQKRRRSNKYAVIESQSQSQLEGDFSQSTGEIVREETDTVLTDSCVVSRRSVWANFKFKMYPGIVKTVSKDTLEIMFEEGIYDIKNTDLYPLDIRIGDVIRQKGSNVPYSITGLCNQKHNDGIVCIRGYSSIYLKRKRAQTRANGKADNEVVVNLSQLFMEINDWTDHQQKYALNLSSSHSDSLTSIVNGNLRTPTRNRTTQDVAVSPVKRKKSDILAGTIFSITAVKEEERVKTETIITENGGEILEEGFMELFTYDDTGNCHLIDKGNNLSQFKFAALISTSHLRSSKYLQALSLGWPILSSTFIYDIEKETVSLNYWPVYLLPAGHSSKIKGIKSLDIFRFLTNYNQKLCLGDQINLHGDLLSDYTIIALNNDHNSKELHVCEFIFYAFGVKKFLIFNSTTEVLKYVKHNHNQKLMIYDNSNTIKRRKPQTNLPMKLITWEWVVQCCISSHIWEATKITI